MNEQEFEIVQKSRQEHSVQVVVLSHNHSSVTKDFLNLLYAHTPSSLFHLIMIDNGSSDDTPDILRDVFGSVNNVTLVMHRKNSGVIGGRNIGCKLALENQPEFEYLMFLDNDQFVMDGWLGQHLAVLNRGYDIIGVEAWQMNSSFLPTKRITGLHEWFNYVGCGGMLIRRQVIDAVGVLDDRYNPAYFEDPDYICRCFDAGFKIGWNAKAQIQHLGHQTLGGNSLAKHRQFFASWEKFRTKWSKRVLPRFNQRFVEEFKR